MKKQLKQVPARVGQVSEHFARLARGDVQKTPGKVEYRHHWRRAPGADFAATDHDTPADARAVRDARFFAPLLLMLSNAE